VKLKGALDKGDDIAAAGALGVIQSDKRELEALEL